jgi:hypothetical protein
LRPTLAIQCKSFQSVAMTRSSSARPGSHAAAPTVTVESSVDRSYLVIHTDFMSVVRRTISLPAALAARLEREAKRRGTSFSAIVADLATRVPQPLPYAGMIRDDKNLSLRVTEALRRARV